MYTKMKWISKIQYRLWKFRFQQHAYQKARLIEIEKHNKNKTAAHVQLREKRGVMNFIIFSVLFSGILISGWGMKLGSHKN